MINTVVVVYDFYKFRGGINRVALESAICHSKTLEVIYCCGDSVSFGEERHNSVEYHSLANTGDNRSSKIRRGLSTIINVKAVVRFYRLLSTLDPQKTVIHFHGWSMALSGGVVVVAKLLRFKLVYTAHDYSLICPNGVYYNFSKNSDCSLKPLSMHCLFSNCDRYGVASKIFRYLRFAFDILILKTRNRLDHIIYVSNYQKSIFKSIAIKTEYSVLRNPLDDKQVKIDFRKKNREYLYIGRLVPEKGIEMLCEAAVLTNISLSVCGDGPLYNKLRKNFPSIKFLGWIDKHQQEEILSVSSYFVLPSLWRETSALVVDDALRYGLKVIVPDNTGASEKVNETNGVVFEKGSITSLVGAIRRVECLSSGHSQIEPDTKLSYKSYSDRLTEIYIKLLKAK